MTLRSMSLTLAGTLAALTAMSIIDDAAVAGERMPLYALPFNGGRQAPPNLSGITDGTSSTLMVGERLRGRTSPRGTGIAPSMSGGRMNGMARGRR